LGRSKSGVILSNFLSWRQLTAPLVISTRDYRQLNSGWATVPHIPDNFFHPSLSDSNLQFNKLLNAQISASFQTIECERRAKIAEGASLIESKLKMSQPNCLDLTIV
jgi:hypothetical protein